MNRLYKWVHKAAVRRSDIMHLWAHLWKAGAILAILLASFGLAAAQTTPTPSTEGGTTLRGTISDQTKTVNYSYSATAGDILFAHVIGVTEGMNPTLKLLSPAQQSLADTTNDVFTASDSPDARLSYVLKDAGTYTLQVGGTSGDFVLHFSVRQSAPNGSLVIGKAVTVDTSPGAVQVYTFPPDPNNDLTLSMTATTSDFAFNVEVYAPTGQLVASVGGPELPSAQLVFGPAVVSASDVYEVAVAALSADKQGSVTLLLSSGGTASNVTTVTGTPTLVGATGTPGAGPTSTPTGNLTPGATQAATSTGSSTAPTDVCTAAPNSTATVNVRSGPGVFYPIIRSLLPGSYLIINGRNAGATWYASILGTKEAWVSRGAVTLSGPCDTLRVLQPPIVPTPVVTPHH